MRGPWDFVVNGCFNEYLLVGSIGRIPIRPLFRAQRWITSEGGTGKSCHHGELDQELSAAVDGPIDHTGGRWVDDSTRSSVKTALRCTVQMSDCRDRHVRIQWQRALCSCTVLLSTTERIGGGGNESLKRWDLSIGLDCFSINWMQQCCFCCA